jgi:zinc/manganese transport system substrate-binding protein
VLRDAGLVVVNGLGLEGWADRLVKASGYKGPLVVASRGIKPVASKEAGHAHGHAHARNDPHAWQDVANVKLYVGNIRDALTAVDARGEAYYEARAGEYLERLDALEAEIKNALTAIPKAQRRVITSHEAFGYYGRAYDVEFLAPQAVGDSEPTAKDVASLIRQIKRARVKAVFVENISNPRLVERIAKETGITLGGALYSDALSEAGGPAATYIDMMRHNTRLLAAAMK